MKSLVQAIYNANCPLVLPTPFKMTDNSYIKYLGLTIMMVKYDRIKLTRIVDPNYNTNTIQRWLTATENATTVAQTEFEKACYETGRRVLYSLNKFDDIFDDIFVEEVRKYNSRYVDYIEAIQDYILCCKE